MTVRRAQLLAAKVSTRRVIYDTDLLLSPPFGQYQPLSGAKIQ